LYRAKKDDTQNAVKVQRQEVKGHVKSQRDITCARIWKIINNSARDCLISFKFRTDFAHITLYIVTNFQGQRVKGQGHSVT